MPPAGHWGWRRLPLSFSADLGGWPRRCKHQSDEEYCTVVLRRRRDWSRATAGKRKGQCGILGQDHTGGAVTAFRCARESWATARVMIGALQAFCRDDSASSNENALYGGSGHPCRILQRHLVAASSASLAGERGCQERCIALLQKTELVHPIQWNSMVRIPTSLIQAYVHFHGGLGSIEEDPLLQECQKPVASMSNMFEAIPSFTQKLKHVHMAGWVKSMLRMGDTVEELSDAVLKPMLRWSLADAGVVPSPWAGLESARFLSMYRTCLGSSSRTYRLLGNVPHDLTFPHGPFGI